MSTILGLALAVAVVLAVVGLLTLGTVLARSVTDLVAPATSRTPGARVRAAA